MKNKSPTTNRLSFTTIGLAYLVWIGLGISYAEIDPKPIVGAWLFNETKGKIAADPSGNNHNGKLEGGAKGYKGKFGNAIQMVRMLGLVYQRLNYWKSLLSLNGSTPPAGSACGDVSLIVMAGLQALFTISSDPTIRWRWLSILITRFATLVGRPHPSPLIRRFKISGTI